MLPRVTVLEVTLRSVAEVRPAVLDVFTVLGDSEGVVVLLPSTVARRESAERVEVLPLRPVEGVEERPEVLPIVLFRPLLERLRLL